MNEFEEWCHSIGMEETRVVKSDLVSMEVLKQAWDHQQKKLDRAIEVMEKQQALLDQSHVDNKKKSLLNIVDSKVRERFSGKYTIDKATECWEWGGSLNKGGYGQMSINNRPYLSHRISCAIYKKDFNDALVVDHICRNRKCCNPDHLRMVTTRVNCTENSKSISSANKSKTHCKQGHEFTKGNTKWRWVDKERTKRTRVCRECNKKWDKKKNNPTPNKED